LLKYLIYLNKIYEKIWFFFLIKKGYWNIGDKKSISFSGFLMGIIAVISFFAGFSFWPIWILFILSMIYFSSKSKK